MLEAPIDENKTHWEPYYLINYEPSEKSYDYKKYEFLKNPQLLNYYTYSLNNPIKNIDPHGEFTEETTDKIIENSLGILGLGIFTAMGGEAMIWRTGPAIVKLGAEIVQAIIEDPDVKEYFSNDDSKIDDHE